MKTDLDIARAAAPRQITEIAADLGLSPDDIDLYGRYKAKIHFDLPGKGEPAGGAKYVVVTAMTPTRHGEGKTTTTVGLSQAFNALGERSIATIRQPSMGPTFGIKGGAAGGGRAQVIPMEELNLHLTGDIHAVTSAHSLLAAAVDARLYHEERLDDKRLRRRRLKRLDIDPGAVTWKRVVDMGDRALRDIVVSDGGEGVRRHSGYDISAASEVMAILALASGLPDLRRRLGRIVVGFDRAGSPVTAEDLGAAGAMAVLLKDAMMPNLMQTLENSPVLVHAGPFANIAHGNSSIVADDIALRLLETGYLVTESGFGADCGFEKFCHVKCRYSGLEPDCAVIVATVRAIKSHGGAPASARAREGAGKAEEMEWLEKGLGNLAANIGIVRRFGVPAVVALNRFSGDSDAEVDRVIEAALAHGAEAACACEVWEHGGAGGADLARAVIDCCESGSSFRPLYGEETPLREKIETVASQVYGASGVAFAPEAEKSIERCEQLGFGTLPVNMAKTHLSLSHDPELRGVPAGFELPVRDVALSAGAGFLVPLCGEIRRMPGLPSRPAFMNLDLDEEGQVVGLA